MGLSVLILIGFLHLTASQYPCSTLVVFEGEQKRENINCTQHGTNRCQNGPAGGFPGNLSAGLSVSPPRNFRSTPFRRNKTIHGTPFEASGVKFDWKVPGDSLSRTHLKGFYLKMQPVGSGNLLCRLWDLTGFNMNSTPNFNFSYELFPLPYKTTYLIDLFSLPPPTDAEYENGLFGRYVVSVDAPRNLSKTPVVYPSQWSTWISVKKHETLSKVEVTFGFPGEGREQFVQYLLQLVSSADKVIKRAPYDTPPNGERFGSYNFTGVPSGLYRVQIQPIDTKYTDNKHCECWRKSNFLPRECTPCITTETETFNFTSDRSVAATSPPSSIAPSSSVAPSSSLDSSTPSSPSTTNSNSAGNAEHQISTAKPVNVGVIVGAVVGSLVGVAIVVFAVVVCRQKKCDSADTGKMPDGRIDRNQNNISTVAKVFKRKSQMLVPGLKKDLKVPVISRKKVVVLASEDHIHFNQALQAFCKFLQLHCQCDVVFAPDQLADVRRTANSYCWLSGKIDSADFVVIVASEAACRLYQASQNGLVYKDAELGPEGDLFTPGIKHICGKISSGEDVSKVMMVHFAHTLPKHRLPISALRPCFYLLPNRLKTFLLHLHGLDENTMDLTQVNLPLQGNVRELEGGKEWLDAVKKAAEFERDHPSWFESKFKRPVDNTDKDKPGFNSQVSKLSDESGFFEGQNSGGLFPRRLSSVSTHAEDNHSEFAAEGVDNPSFVITKSDFFAPSELEARSCYTLPYSAFTEADRPLELDVRSVISDELRMLNERNEQAWLGPACVGHEERPAVSSPNLNQHSPHNMGYPENVDFCIAVQDPDPDPDCISVSSAQSV